MNIKEIQKLIEQPQENLSTELKVWIDPDSPEGITKIVKAALALRNQNGGYLLIGFNDDNTPEFKNAPNNIEELFHIDKIQGIVSKYSSETFELNVHFPTLEDQLFPVIEIPPGFKTPVAVKSDLKDGKGKFLLREHDVYVRSLKANNTASTTKANWRDWNSLIERCFENREADIGRFLRRHLGGLSPEIIKQLAATFKEAEQPDKTIEEKAMEYLQESETRYQAVIKERGYTLPEHGAWDVAVIIDGDVPLHSTNLGFLNLLKSNNPRHTGWPVWVIFQKVKDVNIKPFVNQNIWEAFIKSKGNIDFWRLDPLGRFFIRSALHDDVRESRGGPQPLTVFDFAQAIYRTGEAIAVALSFARAMGCVLEETNLLFLFKWTRLKNRELCSWTNLGRDISPGRKAYQDEVYASVAVPLDTPSSALGQFVHQVTKPLFEIFDGFPLNIDITEDLTRSLIERRC